MLKNIIIMNKQNIKSVVIKNNIDDDSEFQQEITGNNELICHEINHHHSMNIDENSILKSFSENYSSDFIENNLFEI